jgi:cystathionine gamma-synthase
MHGDCGGSMNEPCKDLPAIGGEHGVSAVFTKLADLIAFKEGSIRITRGYPRFVNHPYVDAFARVTVPGSEYRWAVSSVEAGRYLRDRFSQNLSIEIFERAGAAVLTVPDREQFALLYEDIRNTGFTLSSRRAKRLLCGVNDPEPDYLDRCVKKISSFEKGSRIEDTFLFSSGMGAIFAALCATFDEQRPGVCIIGNPYVDTIQLFSKFLTRKNFAPPSVVEGYEEFEMTTGDDTGIVFLEIPTNPLLRVADLEKIVHFARARDIRVIVDATIATPYNINPLQYGADIVMHSTTKFLNGHNDHLGGVLLVNPESPDMIGRKIKDFLALTGSGMDPEEGKVLFEHLAGFQSRMEKINNNALLVARYLSSHQAVDCVNYPFLDGHPDRHLAAKYLKGGSGVVSFSLRGSSFERASAFYDRCRIPGKGPSLGAEETLLCPITLLTYYKMDDAALEAMGLDRYLMRISVGTEDPYLIISQLEDGLLAVEDA